MADKELVDFKIYERSIIKQRQHSVGVFDFEVVVELPLSRKLPSVFLRPKV